MQKISKKLPITTSEQPWSKAHVFSYFCQQLQRSYYTEKTMYRIASHTTLHAKAALIQYNNER